MTREHTPGAKAPSSRWARRAKAEALAYLRAKTKMATFAMKMIQGAFESKFSVQVRGMRKGKFEERRFCLA